MKINFFPTGAIYAIEQHKNILFIDQNSPLFSCESYYYQKPDIISVHFNQPPPNFNYFSLSKKSFLLPQPVDDGSPFSNGFATIFKNNKPIIVDENGQPVLPGWKIANLQEIPPNFPIIVQNEDGYYNYITKDKIFLFPNSLFVSIDEFSQNNPYAVATTTDNQDFIATVNGELIPVPQKVSNAYLPHVVQTVTGELIFLKTFKTVSAPNEKIETVAGNIVVSKLNDVNRYVLRLTTGETVGIVDSFFPTNANVGEISIDGRRFAINVQTGKTLFGLSEDESIFRTKSSLAFLKVKERKFSPIGNDGYPELNFVFDNVDYREWNFPNEAIVIQNGKCNVYSDEIKGLLLPRWFERIINKSADYYIVSENGLMNYYDFKRDAFLFQCGFENVENFDENGNAVVFNLNRLFDLVNQKGEILIKDALRIERCENRIYLAKNLDGTYQYYRDGKFSQFFRDAKKFFAPDAAIAVSSRNVIVVVDSNFNEMSLDAWIEIKQISALLE